MRRDIDLVRQLLFLCEAEPVPYGRFTGDLQDHSPERVRYHLDLMVDAGLIHRLTTDRHGELRRAPEITWKGYELLEAIRDPHAWRYAQQAMSNGFVAELAEQLLVARMTDKVGRAAC